MKQLGGLTDGASNLRILFVHGPLDVRGGNEKALEILVQELTWLGDEVLIASMRKQDTHESLMEYINPRRFFWLKDTILPSRQINGTKSAALFRIILRRIRTDVTVSMSGSTEGAALCILHL